MPNKVDYRTFSQRVKNKYPEYINMGDLELAQMWVNENPQYGEFVIFDQQPVKKKDQAAPSLGAQGGLPSQQPSAQPKRAKEERFFGGTFGNLLDALDMPTPGVPGSGLGIGDFIDDMGRAFFSGKKAGVNMSASRPLFFSGPGSSDEEVQNFVKAGTEYIGPSDEATQFYKDYEDSGKTTFGFVKALAKNPGIAPELVVQSASQLLFNPEARATFGTAIAAGAGIGALAGGVGAAPGAIAAIVPGVAAANTAVSTLSSFSELMKQELDQRGLEFNEDNVRTILEDEKALRKIRAKSAGYGITIGAFDLATAKVGGAIAAKIPMTTRAGKIRSTLAITGAEAVGGSAGEAAARGVTGQELDPAEIGLEGIAEIPGAAPTMLSQVLKKPTYKINGEFVGQADVDDILQNSSRQELENTKFEVFNDVNMYGSKFRNRLEDLGLLEEITEANPNASEADINRLFELNSKLKKVEKLNSESAKASTDWLRSQIREVQDGLLTQEFAPQEARQAEEAAPEAPQMAPAEVSPEVGMEIPQEDQGVLQVINSVVQPISSDIEARMNNAEEIPMSEIEAVVDALIDAQQSVRSQEGARTRQTQGGFVTEFGALSEDQKRNFDTLIEQQINKLLNYEFATITTTEQAGEKTKTAGLVATPREGRPLPESVVSRDRFDGAGVRIGGRGAGRITVKRLPGFGGRSVYGVSFGNRKGVAPVEDLEFDNLEFVAPEILADGSFNARIKDSQSGLEFTITDPELSIDLAIAAQLKEAGRKEFPQPAFLEAVREVTQGQPTQVTTFPNLGRTGTTPAAVGVEPQTEQDVRQETNAPQEGRGQGEDAAPVPQEEGRQEGQVTPLDVAQEGETPPATKRMRKTEQQKADKGKAALDKLKETIRTLRAKPGGGANIDLTFGVVPISKAVWNTALDTAILAIDAGQSIAQAVKAASDYISSKIDGDWGKAKFEQYMDERFGQAPLNQQIDDVAKSAGVSPKNFRDLYRVNRELFGLNQSEAMSAAIAMDKMIDVMAKRDGVSKTETYGRLNFKKATEQDLPQGAIKQDKEEILRVFHGTSKDKDFKKFKDNGKGVFVTISPKEASEYAEQNDSMKFGDYDPVTRKFREINTASRVIPMNLKLGNSYKLTKADLEFLNSKPNYSALQKELHTRIKANGFDTIDYGNGVYAVLTEGRLRSMLTNEALFQKDLPQGVKFQVDAWHGSPYQFDKFTTEKIGTGEGAQAFGWGLYFTDLESIARRYAETLGGLDAKIYANGKEISYGHPLFDYQQFLIRANGDVNSVLSELKDIQKLEEGFPKSARTKAREKAIVFLEKSPKIKIDANKALYKVSLHKGKTPDQYTWLEWDKPVGEENAKKILAQLKKNGLLEKAEANWSRKNMGGSFSGKESLENDLKNLRGDHLYERFLSPRVTPVADGLGTSAINRLFGSAKDASLFLLDAGIDGVKYPAESIARGATSDTARGFNYVVFDENAVSIEEVIKFQKDAVKARGAMMITLDRQATIYALTDPNVSTPLHELAHVFEHYLTDEEKATVQEWAKTEDWTIKTSEAFARGFEKYLAEGKAPTPALQKIFDNFKQWLTDIYRGIVGSDIDIELNKPMRDLYAKMFEFTGEDGPSNFEKWKGDNKLLVGPDIQDAKTGEPIVVRAYHGTTNEFYEFDSSVKGSVEGHLGKINYFTSDYQDAAINYLSEGPDLTRRVEGRTDQIESELKGNYDDYYESIPKLSKKYGYTEEELQDDFVSFRSLARDLAKKELYGGTNKVLDVFIKLNNPVVLGKGSTWFQTLNISETDLDQAAQEIADENDISVEEAKQDYDFDIRDRAIENAGYENLAVDALDSALRSNGYRGASASEILGDNLYESDIDLNRLEKELRQNDKAGLFENEEGELASSQVVSDFLKNLGFDGIILTDVSNRFRGMGLGSSTSHIHVFDEFANQIKLADGSNTTFGETRDIRFQLDKGKPQQQSQPEVSERGKAKSAKSAESLARELEKALNAMKVKVDKGVAREATFMIPALVYNGAIDAAILAVKAGKTVANAVIVAVKYINKKFDGEWDKGGFTDKMIFDLTKPKTELTISGLKNEVSSLIDRYNDEEKNGGKPILSLHESIYDKFRKEVTQELNNINALSESIGQGDAELLKALAMDMEQVVSGMEPKVSPAIMKQDRPLTIGEVWFDLKRMSKRDSESINLDTLKEEAKNITIDDLTIDELKKAIHFLEIQSYVVTNRRDRVFDLVRTDTYDLANKLFRLDLDDLSILSGILQQDAGKALNEYIGNIKKSIDAIRTDSSPSEIYTYPTEPQQQAQPEAKPEKNIAEQRKEFRETAKKYFDGLKKMGISFDPERNSKEDIAFLKDLAKYIKLELDAGMVTFKGFLEKTANLIEGFNEKAVVAAAKEAWAKEVVKAYPKLYAKYNAAKRKELEREIKDIRKTMIRRIIDMTEPKIVNFKSQLKTEKRRLSKEAAAQLAAIRNAYDAKTMMAMEPQDLMELLNLTEGIYKEGRSEIKALNESLDEAAQIQGEEMLAAIASKDKRLEKLDSKEAASKMLAKKAGVVVAVKGDDRVIMKEEKDLEALDGEGYTFLFLNTTSDKFVDRSFLDSVVSFFSGKLRTINENARDLRTALELIKSRSKESQDFINGLVAKMNKASVTKARKSEEWSSILKKLRFDLFGPDIKFGYTNWMNAIAKVNGKPLKLINGKGVSIGPINNGKIVSLYRQIMDPTNLVKTDGVRKIDLSDESIQSIIDYMNLPGNLPGKEFALSLTSFFIKVAKDTKAVLENNGYNSTKLDEKRYNKEDFEGDDFIAKVMDQLAETRSEGFIPYTPIQATESPDNSQGVEINEDDLLDSGDLQKNFSVISNNMITRRPGGVIIPTDIRQTLNAYPAGMANMNAKLPILRETQSVFSKRNLTAMNNAFAPQFTENLKANYISFMTDRVTPVISNKTEAAMKTWLMTSTAIPMFLNPKTGLLQLLGSPNFIVSYDLSKYIDASKKLLSDGALFKETILEIINLPIIKQRYGGRFSPDSRVISEEMSKYGKVTINIPFTNLKISAKELLSKGYIFSSIGDVFAIAFGGAPIYYDIVQTNKKKYMAEGMSVFEAETKAKQDAEEKLFEIIQETQQSSEAMYLSQFQKQSITRIFSSFATATMQYYRKARRAAARMKNKEGNQLQNAYEILHYTAINAAVFQFFSSMFVDWLSGPGEDELEEMSREERMDFVRYMEDVMATVAQGTGGLGVALQALILAYKESEKSGKPEKIVESALRTVPAVRMKYDAAVNTIREWKRGDYVRSLTKGAELANIPADRIRSLGLQVSDALMENLDAQERIARLMGFRTESWMREKKQGEIWNGVQSAVDKSTPAERQRAISNTKSAYRDLFQLYGKRYAEATTEAEKARVDSIASKELLNVYNHRQGGPELTEELQKLFNQSAEFNSLPKDMQKLKNMESNRKIGDIVEEVLSLEKKSEQKAMEYWSSLVNNGVISKNEIERIREEYNTRKGLQ